MLYVKLPLTEAEKVRISRLGHHHNGTDIIVNEMVIRTNGFISGDAFEAKVASVSGTILSNPEARNIINQQNYQLCHSLKQ